MSKRVAVDAGSDFELSFVLRGGEGSCSLRDRDGE